MNAQLCRCEHPKHAAQCPAAGGCWCDHFTPEPEQVPLYHAPEHLKGQQTLDLVAQMRERFGLNLCHRCGLDLDGNPPDCGCDN
jgi:hypothetical protein